VIGGHDGQSLGFVIRDELGQMIGVAAGYTWAGISELRQMWVDEAYRGQGYGRALLNAFVEEESGIRGVLRIWVSSYDFQAPEMYEEAGFKRMAEFEGWPGRSYQRGPLQDAPRVLRILTTTDLGDLSICLTERTSIRRVATSGQLLTFRRCSRRRSKDYWRGRPRFRFAAQEYSNRP
jgi:hypothetical protein